MSNCECVSLLLSATVQGGQTAGPPGAELQEGVSYRKWLLRAGLWQEQCPLLTTKSFLQPVVCLNKQSFYFIFHGTHICFQDRDSLGLRPAEQESVCPGYERVRPEREG